MPSRLRNLNDRVAWYSPVRLRTATHLATHRSSVRSHVLGEHAPRGTPGQTQFHCGTGNGTSPKAARDCSWVGTGARRRRPAIAATSVMRKKTPTTTALFLRPLIRVEVGPSQVCWRRTAWWVPWSLSLLSWLSWNAGRVRRTLTAVAPHSGGDRTSLGYCAIGGTPNTSGVVLSFATAEGRKPFTTR